MIIVQLIIVVGSYMLREFLCWQENDFCSLDNSQCLRSKIVWIAGPPIALECLALVGLLVDDCYGWGALFARFQGIFKCPGGQVAPAEGDIELDNMNVNNAAANNNQGQTVRMKYL